MAVIEIQHLFSWLEGFVNYLPDAVACPGFILAGTEKKLGGAESRPNLILPLGQNR